MISQIIIVDTGVLVALISKRDQWHTWAVEKASELQPPFFTCEAVLTETSYLLGASNLQVLGMVEKRIIQGDFSLFNEVSTIGKLVLKYKDVPMDLADACLVRMSELIDDSIVFTVDSDFLIYRKNGKERIPLISPH